MVGPWGWLLFQTKSTQKSMQPVRQSSWIKSRLFLFIALDEILFKWTVPGLFFFIFVFSTQLINFLYKN